jgi:hypothetical protein
VSPRNAHALRLQNVLGEEVSNERGPVLDQERPPVGLPGEHGAVPVVLDLFQDVVELGREQIFELFPVVGGGGGSSCFHGVRQQRTVAYSGERKGSVEF